MSKKEQEMSWNYRVLQSFDGEEYFIGEVYYDADGNIRAWADADDGALKWEVAE